MSTQPTAINAVQAIPIGSIVPNPNNPRGKHFDKQALEDLADSIKAHGVRQPALLRPNGSPGKYEIVCGERRWRASKLAGKDTLPAIVDPSITDEQAIEIGILENLQREDVHPLDEALGYKTLLEQKQPTEKKVTPESIAAKVGKSASYVYQRLKLAELSKKGQEDFRTDFITAAHAIDIARLQPEDQARALEFCHRSEYGSARSAAPPFRELRKWIQENVQLNLDKAPFDIGDPKLIPSAGACTDCPKRTGSNPSLFEGMAGKNTCMDPTCYQAKKMALVNINVDQVAKKHKGEKPILISHQYSPERGTRLKGVLYEGDFRDHVYKAGKEQKIAPGSCPNARLAVYIDEERFGPSKEKAGQVVTICTAKRGCKIHQDVYSSSAGGNDAEIRRKQRIYREYTAAVFRSIAAVMKQPKREDLITIACEFFQKLGHYQEKPLLEILGWDEKLAKHNGRAAREKHFAGMTNEQLQNSFVLMAIASDLVTPGSYSMGGWTPKLLEAVAGRHGIKLEPLKTAARDKFTKKKAKAKKGKKAA